MNPVGKCTDFGEVFEGIVAMTAADVGGDVVRLHYNGTHLERKVERE